MNKGLGEVVQKNTVAGMANWFLRFADQCQDSKIYAELSRRISRDEGILNIALKGNLEQPIPNLLLAAIAYLRSQVPQESLLDFYQEVLFDNKGIGQWKKLQDFVFENQVAIIEILKSRTVQTNEIQRSSLLYLALSHLAQENKFESVILVDVGASCGFNLLLDKFSYWRDSIFIGGEEKSEMRLNCDYRGSPAPIGLKKIKVVKRIGMDLNPIDLGNRDEQAWLRSLIWPDQTERLNRFETGVRIFAGESVELQKGSALELLPLLPNQISKFPGMPVVIMHSFTLNQFSSEDRVRFENILLKLSEKLNLMRISLEWIATESPELKVCQYPQETIEGKTNRVPRWRTLGTCHHHGNWIELSGKNGNLQAT